MHELDQEEPATGVPFHEQPRDGFDVAIGLVFDLLFRHRPRGPLQPELSARDLVPQLFAPPTSSR